MARIGYLSNGAAWLTAYHDLLDEEMGLRPIIFDTSRRWPTRLAKVDILLIPWAPDALWIAARRRRLLRFLDRGGLLIAFGEFESDWVPNMIWTKTIEDHVVITTVSLTPDGERARRMIFNGISDQDLANWADTCHGYFRALPDHCDVLVENPTGQPVAVFDGQSFKGALLVSSIDPDFHTYARNPTAREMFRQIIDWCLCHVEAEGGYRREIQLPRAETILRAIRPVMPSVVVEGLIALFVAVVVTILWP